MGETRKKGAILTTVEEFETGVGSFTVVRLKSAAISQRFFMGA